MATTYNRNAFVIDTEIWTPFNPTTGAASNIDDVIANVGAQNVLYVGGVLAVGGVVVSPGEHAYVGDDDSVGKLTPAELAVKFTVAP